MKKKIYGRAAAALLAVLVGISGCAASSMEETVTAQFYVGDESKEETTSSQESKEETTSSQESQEGTTSSQESKQEPVEALNQFSIRVFDSLLAEENMFMSPYSIYSALGMLAECTGTDGALGDFLSALGMEGSDKEGLAAAFKELYQTMTGKENTEVLIANSVWLDQDLELSSQADELKALLEDSFYAQIKTEDLHAADAADKINAWVSENTKGMIPSILESGKKMDTCLVNAVYFNGIWQDAFDPALTYEGLFFGNNGESNASYMSRKADTQYGEMGDIKSISIPYTEGEYEAVFYLPVNQEDNIADLWQGMTQEEKEALLGMEYEEAEVRTALPVIELDYKKDLKELFEDLGLGAVYSPDEGYFSALSDGLRVTEAMHAAKMSMNEEGTEAAAVTGIVIEKTSMLPDQEKTFIADHPYMFVIRETGTGAVLFMGYVESMPE